MSTIIVRLRFDPSFAKNLTLLFYLGPQYRNHGNAGMK